MITTSTEAGLRPGEEPDMTRLLDRPRVSDTEWAQIVNTLIRRLDTVLTGLASS